MINPDKIDEWIREVEERPSSAPLIIRYIANRLSELISREEELAAENIELLSGRKVEEYENRIASLEYQLELLKRQLGGEITLPLEAPFTAPTQIITSLLVYNTLGKALRVELNPTVFETVEPVTWTLRENEQEEIIGSVAATSSQEELLFIFDSGRTVAHPVAHVPASSQEILTWDGAFFEEPRIKEELVTIQSIAKMPLFEHCIQASRRGYVKKMKMASFTTHLAEDYIGAGVKLPADKTCGVTFANSGNLFVLVSQEGFIFSMPVEQLPIAIEEVIRLGITDHIVSMFAINQERSVAFVTQAGKIVHRDASWLEPASSFKSHGQAILSKERREAGTRIVGAAAVNECDWGAFLFTDGTLHAYPLKSLLDQGSVPAKREGATVTSFTTFQPAQPSSETKNIKQARR